jgi:hypothetical protein
MMAMGIRPMKKNSLWKHNHESKTMIVMSFEIWTKNNTMIRKTQSQHYDNPNLNRQ